MSLILPDHHRGMVGTICGIDPGTNMLGFAALEVDLKTLEVVGVTAQSFKSEAMIDRDTFIPLTHNERIAKILAQQNNLIQQFRFYKPFVIACENPFINRLRPAAYGPLVEIVFAIRMAAIEYSSYTKFLTYEPSTVKKTVGAGAICGKEEIKFVICNNPELSPNAFTNLSNLDEHAIDALAVAYTHLLKRRKE